MQFTSFNSMIEASIRSNWDLPALSNYKAETFTYAQLAEKIAKLHILFAQSGVQKGDRIALASKNQAHWAVTFLSATTYGAVPVPILHEFKADSIHHLVGHSQAKMLFVDEHIASQLDASQMPSLEFMMLLSDFSILYSKGCSAEQLTADVEKAYQEKYPDGVDKDSLSYHRDQADELALINYTSGTSGFSKGVMIPYRALWSNVEFSKIAEPQIKAGDQVVSMLPSAHMYGMMFELLFELCIGAHVHFLTKTPSPKVILEAFAAIKPCVVIAVPLIIEKIYKSKLKPLIDKNAFLLSLPIIGGIVRKKFRSELVKSFGGEFEEIILGGAAFNPEIEKFFHSIKFPYTVGYGMTECAPIITYAHWNKAKLNSCGKAAPRMEIRIDSSDPQNIPGEVMVKGDNVFLGYYMNEEATKAAFTEDGWFLTGDMGVMDKDGYLYLRGRSKCMILGPSGQNIYPEEVEAVINNMDYVADSLVVEEDATLTAIIHPDYAKAEHDGMDKKALEEMILASLPELNTKVPNYARIKKIEILEADFERTPKKSIKRYLYAKK